MGIANAVRDVAGDESDQQNPQRAVNRNRHEQIKAQDRQAHDDAGKQQRQGRQQIEQPPAAHFGAHQKPRGEQWSAASPTLALPSPSRMLFLIESVIFGKVKRRDIILHCEFRQALRWKAACRTATTRPRE